MTVLTTTPPLITLTVYRVMGLSPMLDAVQATVMLLIPAVTVPSTGAPGRLAVVMVLETAE
jgi:hypothetical protein